MADWTKSMQQTFEFYVVDPGTWKDSKLLTTVKSCAIDRDSTADTLGSASFDIAESVGECYIRVYLITVQNGVKEKYPLGTFLVQTPSSDFDGKIRSVTMDAYTPLLELTEKQPPIGYYVPRSFGQYKVNKQSDGTYVKTDDEIEISYGQREPGLQTTTGEDVYFGTTDDNKEVYYCVVGNFMELAYRLTRDNLRAPVVKPEYNKPLTYDFVSDLEDTWLTFLKDLISNANYEFSLDEMGRVLFAPKQDTASLQPVWTYEDDDISILYPELSMDHDLYGVPNVVEVVYSSGTDLLHARVENTDENSPTSIPTRGREVVHREINPSLPGIPDQAQIDKYAEDLLRAMSAIDYTVTYTHGYCPVRPGDCVRINYSRAGLTNIKAKVISQSIKCEPGCPVTEKAVFSTNLWR
jgi:hypothetical protein